MNLFDRMIFRLAEWRASSGAGFHVSQTPPGWIDRLGGMQAASGVIVSEESALRLLAVYACVRILAESESSLPLVFYERLDDDTRRRARAHPLYEVLHDLPNPSMSSMELRETLMGHLTTWGNAFAEIAFDNRGQVTGLWPLRPDRMHVKRENGVLLYEYQLLKPDTQGRLSVTLTEEQIFHVRGLGYDGLVGYSPIAMARQAIGLGLATEEYGGRFFANGARPGGVLEHPGQLSTPAYARLRDSWETRHQGLENASRVAILEEGMKYQQVGIPPEEAQFLETRKFQVQEIARLYRIPPHMLADLDRATFSNIEHQSIEFVVHTLRPWLVRWEQAIYRALLLPRERGRYFAEHVVDALLRGDTQSRYQAYSVGRQWGWLSANDVRRLENLNPVDGGDMYLTPLNMVPAEQVGMTFSMERALPASEELRVKSDEPGVRSDELGVEQRSIQGAQLRHRLQAAIFRTYADVAARVLRREVHDVGEAARKLLPGGNWSGFLVWLDGFYRDHWGFVHKAFSPVTDSYGEMVTRAVEEEIGGEWWNNADVTAWIASYLSTFAARHCHVSESRVNQAGQWALDHNEDVYQTVVDELSNWEETRSVETARWESVRFNNALAVGIYIIAGRTKLIWRAFGENCPYCNSLDGRVIGINTYFVTPGDFQPDGAESPLSITGNHKHAPIHDGCDCMVTSG